MNMADTGVAPPQSIAAVLADVDGTLVTKKKVVTPRAIEAIEELHRRGVIFAITSGRPPRGMKMLVEPLEMRGPMAAFNGGIIVQPDMTIVDERSVPEDVTPAVIDMIHDHGLEAWIYRATDWYVNDFGTPRAAHEATTVQFEPSVVRSYDGLMDRVVKIVGVSEDHDRVARCEATVQQEFGMHTSAARSQPYSLDVTNPTANKGVVVERMSHYYGVPLDQIATLGDQANDVLMFQRSGMSIAMGNAGDEVQRQATFVTSSNEDEGFAKAIEEFILPLAVPAPPVPQSRVGESA
jgi:Cof subfamily protein (haloacid dehalogenase superfamily)